MKVVLALLLFEGFTASPMAAQVSAPTPDSAQSTPQVDPPYAVKLLDFGLAKAFAGQKDAPSSPNENSPTLTIGATEIGVVLGTAAYMSPEQARCKQVDKRADIWAFGVLMFELLTGQRPFKHRPQDRRESRRLRDCNAS